MTRPLAGALALLALLATAAGADGSRHVVIVSIDGLRPEFYLDPAFPAPALRDLVARGAHARTVETVFPSVTYPGHASIATGVRPARHGVAFNNLFLPGGGRGRWYEEAADLRTPPLWDWARAAGLRTAAVSWPSTLGAKVDLLVPERAYYARREPLDLLRAAVTPGLFALTRVEPDGGIFRDSTRWDDFLARTAVGLIREARPRLLLVHLVQTDSVQHRGGRDGADVKPAVRRVDEHVGAIVAALRAAGIADRTAVIVVGDHGFDDFTRLVAPNEVLSRAGLRACPTPGPGWRATAHVAGGAAAVFVKPGDDEGRALAESALRGSASGRYTVLTRAELDGLGAMPGAALGLEAAPGWSIEGGCGRGLTRGARGGMHGYLPSRATMATGFIAAGAGIRPAVAIGRARLIDVAPTAARLLGIAAPDVEGRVLAEILREP
ncbi:MAG: alkaline phosphatase family protein [Candidatus Rokubacteria bacterium]|nr:alkaline phosphatase family protein [Candidatus Rokubacteria bacterium]